MVGNKKGQLQIFPASTNAAIILKIIPLKFSCARQFYKIKLPNQQKWFRGCPEELNEKLTSFTSDSISSILLIRSSFSASSCSTFFTRSDSLSSSVALFLFRLFLDSPKSGKAERRVKFVHTMKSGRLRHDQQDQSNNVKK